MAPQVAPAGQTEAGVAAGAQAPPLADAVIVLTEHRLLVPQNPPVKQAMAVGLALGAHTPLARACVIVTTPAAAELEELEDVAVTEHTLFLQVAPEKQATAGVPEGAQLPPVAV